MIGAVLGIVGVIIALGGTALYYSATRPRVADLVADAEFQAEMLTDAEALDVIVAHEPIREQPLPTTSFNDSP